MVARLLLGDPLDETDQVKIVFLAFISRVEPRPRILIVGVKTHNLLRKGQEVPGFRVIFRGELEKRPGVAIARVGPDDFLAELHKLRGPEFLRANRIKFRPRLGMIRLAATGLLMTLYQPVSEMLLHNPLTLALPW